MKALFIKDWKLLKNQGKMFGAVLVFYGLLAVMDNSMGQSILGFFPFLFGLFTITSSPAVGSSRINSLASLLEIAVSTFNLAFMPVENSLTFLSMGSEKRSQ